MELLRFDSLNYGILYITPAQIKGLGRIDDSTTSLSVEMLDGKGLDIHLSGDIDEVAQMIESNVPSCKIRTIS